MYRILELNPQLLSFAGDIDLRMQLYRDTKQRILGGQGTLNDFANAHEYYGFHHVEGGWYYREWAPSAYQLYLTGEFNGWRWLNNPLTNLGNGDWEIFLPGDDALWDGCKVKTIVDANFTRTEHIPLYARRVVQDPKTTAFCCEVVDDQKTFRWTDGRFKGSDELYIYEAHVGMAQEEGKVGTYREFADNVLPHVKEAGYTAIQLATLTLNDAGYVVDYVIGGDTIVATATRSDRQVTFTMEVDTAYAVTLDGGNYAPNLDVVYLTAGDSVEIEVYADNANWVGHTVNPSAGSFAKEKESEDTKTLYGTYTAAGDLAANTKVTLTVQKLAK